jgi:hypothetical protein
VKREEREEREIKKEREKTESIKNKYVKQFK